MLDINLLKELYQKAEPSSDGSWYGLSKEEHVFYLEIMKTLPKLISQFEHAKSLLRQSIMIPYDPSKREQYKEDIEYKIQKFLEDDFFGLDTNK